MSNSRNDTVTPLTPEYVAEIRKIAATLSPESFEASLKLCAPLHSLEQNAVSGTVTLDLQYGPDDRHCLDLYCPPDIYAQPRPLILFIHGGGFDGGNRRMPGSYLYANVAAWANCHGFAAALMSYRLAPAARWPAGAEDIERALGWLAQNAARLGISSERIVAIGHSAGATHLASWLAGHHSQSSATPNLRGAALISGIFEPASLPFAGAFAYYGDDLTPSRYSTVNGVSTTNVPLLLVAAELDPPEFKAQWETVVSAREATVGAKTTKFIAPHQNHFTLVYHLGVQSDDLGFKMAEFVERCLERLG